MCFQCRGALYLSLQLSEGKSKKQPPTQKYDRKEIQKRLDIENWMDEELKRIYAVEDNDEYPQLDVDDVLKTDEELRRQRLRDLLQTAKEPVEDFITELLEKLKMVKYKSN